MCLSFDLMPSESFHVALFDSLAMLLAEDGSGGQYLLCLESSDVSAVSADLQALGFQSGINPGRMIRVVHTVVRSFATIVRVCKTQLAASQGWTFCFLLHSHSKCSIGDTGLNGSAASCSPCKLHPFHLQVNRTVAVCLSAAAMIHFRSLNTVRVPHAESGRGGSCCAGQLLRAGVPIHRAQGAGCVVGRRRLRTRGGPSRDRRPCPALLQCASWTELSRRRMRCKRSSVRVTSPCIA